MSAAIELAGVGKRYVQVQDRAMLLRSLLPGARRDHRELWALRNLDLTIAEGETVGVLGRNGAGKTTLLRLLAGVTRPSEGRIALHGRVAPLIGVGVGFHPEMSGRENVYVNGMLLGLTKAEVDARFATIVEFAELERFIDTPVKFYSSGMFMRLGFSVAIHVEPRILLVDEVLAVGDIAFQLRCFDRMRALQADGTTIIIVSHSMHAIRLLCPRALLFRNGSLELDGDTETVIAKHHELMTTDEADTGVGGGASVLGHQLLDEHGAPVHSAAQGQLLTYRLDVRFEEAVDSPQLFFFVLAEDGTLAYEMKTAIGRQHRSFAAGEETHAEVRFRAHLGGGTYRLQTAITDRDGRRSLHRDLGGLHLYLAPPLGSAGIADLGATIAIDGEQLSDHKPLLLKPDG